MTDAGRRRLTVDAFFLLQQEESGKQDFFATPFYYENLRTFPWIRKTEVASVFCLGVKQRPPLFFEKTEVASVIFWYVRKKKEWVYTTCSSIVVLLL